mmetsp:Transcript_52157/g.145560  ORF Transcript_52157/g.145560 Transcript_52157/m.145560 type:complete len:342 (+) Transcript_52157:70-1095(+)
MEPAGLSQHLGENVQRRGKWLAIAQWCLAHSILADLVTFGRALRPHGVVYASIGKKYLAMALLSAYSLRSDMVRFNLADDLELALCENATRHLGRKWECFDVRQSQAYLEHAACLADATAQDKILGRSDYMSRVLKLLSILDAPFEVAMFLDSDTKPCHALSELLAAHGLNSASAFSTYDVLIGYARKATNPFSRVEGMQPLPLIHKLKGGHEGIPFAFGEPNSGVILYRADRLVVTRMLKDWLRRYCNDISGKSHHKDQPLLRTALWQSQKKHGLRVMRLLPEWNMKGWRTFMPTDRSCCAPDATRTGLRIIIDHDCTLTPADNFWLQAILPSDVKGKER